MKRPSVTSPEPGAVSLPLQLIFRHHQRARLWLLLCALAVMLAAFAAVLAEALGWWAMGFMAGFGLAVFSAALVIVWLQRISQRDVATTARALDAQWGMQARLESTLELAKDESSLAASLRDETGKKVANKESPFRWRWISVLGLVALLGLAVLGEIVFGFVRTKIPGHTRTGPTTADVSREKPAQDSNSAHEEKALPLKAATDALTEIKWIAPAAQSRATAIEEVRLKALVETRSGLRNVTLELNVNGGPTKVVPVSAATAARIARPGAHEIEQALYLDELSVKEYDVICYSLSADLIAAKATTIASPLQFIQIRAARDEVSRGGADASTLAALLYRLQSAQLDLLQQNFLLAKADRSQTHETWQKSNSAVASGQKDLTGKTGELRALALRESGADLMVDHLAEVATLMTRAAGQIKAEANLAAVPVQQQALALLADCDRLFRQALRAPPPQVNGADPFGGKQKFALPERSETPIGELEALAEKQDRILRELAEAAGQPGASVPANAQEIELSVARGAHRLGGGTGLTEQGQQAARRAAEEARTAAQRMAASDAKGALAPAAATAQALRDALREQETSGRLEALAALEMARREINLAARNGDHGARGTRMTVLAEGLERAAELQQRTGLAEAARQLARLAHGVRLLPDAAPASEAWQAAVRQAAAAQVIIATRRDANRRADRQLKRGRQACAQGDDASGRAEIELAAQIARELFLEVAGQEAARALEIAAANLPQAATSATSAATLVPQCEQVERALLKLRSEGERDERIHRFNADEIDPAYRSAVEDYFERLSREGTSR